MPSTLVRLVTPTLSRLGSVHTHYVQICRVCNQQRGSLSRPQGVMINTDVHPISMSRTSSLVVFVWRRCVLTLPHTNTLRLVILMKSVKLQIIVLGHLSSSLAEPNKKQCPLIPIFCSVQSLFKPKLYHPLVPSPGAYYQA